MEEVADELVKKINKGVDELTVGMPEVRSHIHQSMLHGSALTAWQLCDDCYGLLWRGMFALAIASMALAMSAHTHRLQLSVYIVPACWRSKQG